MRWRTCGGLIIWGTWWRTRGRRCWFIIRRWGGGRGGGGARVVGRGGGLRGKPERAAGSPAWRVAGIVVVLLAGVLAAGLREQRLAAAEAGAGNGSVANKQTNRPPALETRTIRV